MEHRIRQEGKRCLYHQISPIPSLCPNSWITSHISVKIICLKQSGEDVRDFIYWHISRHPIGGCIW